VDVALPSATFKGCRDRQRPVCGTKAKIIVIYWVTLCCPA